MDDYNPFSLSYNKKNKIDNKNKDNSTSIETMKPKYSTDEKLMCGVIEYNKKTYLVDLNDKDRILNFNKNFIFVNETDIYPSYCYNYKRFSYLDFIFNYNQETIYYKFKNDDVQLWLNDTIKTIKEQTDKEIVIRYKDSTTPFMKDFENAYCIISYQSTLAIEAILRGIPSFCNEQSCVSPVSTTTLNLNKIKFPTMIEIENWVTSLLANQFTMEEFKNGVAFEAINRLQNQKYII